MHAKNALVDNGRDGQMVEHRTEVAPQRQGIPPFALIIEAIDPCYRCALVVASEHEDLVRVLDFVSQEQTHCFYRLFSSVNKIPY
jgi:hypothetical protein